MLGQIGYKPDEPYLNEEQYNMLLASDPKFIDRYEKERIMQNDLNYKQMVKEYDPYEMRLPDQGSSSRSPIDLEDIMSSQKKMKKKGGAFAAFLAPLAASLIGSLVPEVVKGITGAIKKKGSGALFKQFMEQNVDTLKEIEDELKHKNPKDAWRFLIDNVKEMVSSIEPQHENIVDKIFPKGFVKSLHSKKSGKGLGRPLNNIDMAMPVIKYALNKMIGSAPHVKHVMQQIKPLIISGSGIYGGKKLNFRKILKFAKKGLKFAIPIIEKVTGKTLDIGAKAVINSLLDKFGIKNETAKQLISNTGKELISEGVKEVMKKEGEGFTMPPNGGFVRPPNVQMNKRGKGEKKKVNVQFKLL